MLLLGFDEAYGAVVPILHSERREEHAESGERSLVVWEEICLP